MKKELLNFDDLVDNMKLKLKQQNLKYKKLTDEFTKIMEDFPNLQLLFEEQTELELNKQECQILQKLVSIYIDILHYEEQELFLLGYHFYPKKIIF